MGDHQSRLTDFGQKIGIEWDIAYARDLVSFTILMKFCRTGLNQFKSQNEFHYFRLSPIAILQLNRRVYFDIKII